MIGAGNSNAKEKSPDSNIVIMQPDLIRVFQVTNAENNKENKQRAYKKGKTVEIMMKEITTVLEASRKWVGTFNDFPLGMITKLFNIDVDDWREITPVSVGCRVCSTENWEMGTVIEITENAEGEEIAVIELDNGEKVEELKEDLSREDDDYFPMWGTMWQFSDSCDNYWLKNHLSEMAECGFRIYESDEFGYFFGIDGAGYDFYESHWIPLYNKRGLKWHNM